MNDKTKVINLALEKKYFANFKCSICKTPATIYRFSSKTDAGKYLCESKECEARSLIGCGYRTLLQVTEIK